MWGERGKVGMQGSGGRSQGSDGGGSPLNSLEDSGKARDNSWGGTRRWTFNADHSWP